MAYKSDPRGTQPVRVIGIHTAEGSRTAASLGSYFWQTATQASSHVGIDAGATLQFVPYDRSAWTMRSANPISDNAELCGFAHWTREQWLSTATIDGCVSPRAILDRAAAWIRSRCLARGIPIRKITPAQLAAGQSGVIAHWDWTIAMHDGTHTDPGAGFPWDYVISKAQAAPEQDWLAMATAKDLEEAVGNGVYNGLGRYVASPDAPRWDGKRNWADHLIEDTDQAQGTNERLDEVIEGQKSIAAAIDKQTAAIKALADAIKPPKP